MAVFIELLVCLLSNVLLLWYVHKRHYFEKYILWGTLPVMRNFDSVIGGVIWCIHLMVLGVIIGAGIGEKLSLVNLCLMLVLAVWLFFLAIVDGEIRILPNAILGMLLGIRIVFWILQMIIEGLPDRSQMIYQVLYTFILFLLLMLVVMIARGGFGYGDVKLLTVLSLFIDYGFLMSTLMTALLVALVVSLYLLAVKKTDRKTTIPFGPFLYLGFVINSILVIWN